MADRTIMNAKDAVSASLAECFVTIGDNRYNFMQATGTSMIMGGYCVCGGCIMLSFSEVRNV